MEAQKQIGNQWSKISALLIGRVDIDVKNRFHKLQRVRFKSTTDFTPERSEHDEATTQYSLEPHPDNNDSFDISPRSLRGSLRSTPEYNEYSNISSKSSRASLHSTPRTPRCQSYDEYDCSPRTSVCGDLPNIIPYYDGSDTVSQITKQPNEEGWYSDFSRDSSPRSEIFPGITANHVPLTRTTSCNTSTVNPCVEKFSGIPLNPSLISTTITENPYIERIPSRHLALSRSSSAPVVTKTNPYVEQYLFQTPYLPLSRAFSSDTDYTLFSKSSSIATEHNLFEECQQIPSILPPVLAPPPLFVEQEILDFLASDMDQMHVNENRRAMGISGVECTIRSTSPKGLQYQTYYLSKC